MPTIRIDYLVDDEGEITPLLTRMQQARLEARAQQAEAEAKMYGFDSTKPIDGQPPAAIGAWIDAKRDRSYLDDDAGLRERYEEMIQTAVFTVSTPLERHQDEIRAEMVDSEGKWQWNGDRAATMAQRMLTPRLENGGGLDPEQPVPVALLPTLREECTEKMFPDSPVKRHFFTTHSPRGSNSHTSDRTEPPRSTGRKQSATRQS